MFFRHLYTDQLAQASYLVGCQQTGEALVVDPTRDLDRYLDLAAREGLRITAVTETHIHADFVSGAPALAARTGARLYLSGAGPAAWQYAYAPEAGATLLRDGDAFTVGMLRLEVLHTPGHTPEHLAFLLTDRAAATVPLGLFSGDVVFVGDVGRPDLLEKAAGVAGTTEGAARQLYHSVRRVAMLPPHLQVWPGHGAGSACGKALGALPQSTIGYEQRTNWAFQPMREEHFVASVLAGQPEPPPYFARMKRVNREGPAPHLATPPARLRAKEIETIPSGGVLVLDLRSAADYATGHLPGTLNLPLGPAFVTWAGWLLPADRPLALIATPADAATAASLLALIGLDDVVGSWAPDIIPAWASGGRTLLTVPHSTPAVIAGALVAQRVRVLDVRTLAEHAAGHIVGSLNIPLGQLPARLAEIPTDRPVVVQCQGGLRSAIAASLLQAHGHTEVVDLEGGFTAWQEAGLPVERGTALPAHATGTGMDTGRAPLAPIVRQSRAGASS